MAGPAALAVGPLSRVTWQAEVTVGEYGQADLAVEVAAPRRQEDGSESKTVGP
jgi:hypothetical protein